MWKASAVSANECARKPHISSSKKKAVSMAIMTLMRVLLDHAMLEKLGMANRNAAPNWRAWTVKSRLQTIEVVRGRKEAVEMCAVEEDDGGGENLR